MKKYILIFLVAVIVVNWGAINRFIDPPPDYSIAHDGKVILYATSWCGYCQKARELLNDNNIAFHEYDVEDSEEGRQQYDRLGGKGVPVLLINGTVVDGYDPSKILKLVN